MDFDDLVKQKKIDLSDEDLDDGNLGILIKVVRKSNVLEELRVRGNRLTLADGKMAEAIARSRTLRVLLLGCNQIADEGAKRLADAIKVNETLQEISLWNNEIGDEGAKSFADALAVNKSLQEVSLAWNKIGNEGAQNLASSFETNRTVQNVFLRENKITDQGALRLADALKNNYTIDHLDLDNNPVSDRVSEKIEAIFNDEIRKYVLEIIASKDEEHAALKEENAFLKAEHSASLKAMDSYKKSIGGPLEQLNKAVKTVDLTGGIPSR